MKIDPATGDITYEPEELVLTPDQEDMVRRHELLHQEFHDRHLQVTPVMYNVPSSRTDFDPVIADLVATNPALQEEIVDIYLNRAVVARDRIKG